MPTPTPKRYPWWLFSIPVLALMLAGFHYLLHHAPGKVRIGVYYLGPLMVSALAILILLIAIIQSAIRRPFFTLPRAIGMLLLIAFPLSTILRQDTAGNFVSAYPSSHAGDRNKVPLRLPLDSPISVFWGGDKVGDNYHVNAPDQRWAYDLVMMRGETTFAGDSLDVSNYFCYGQPVLAPASGSVVDVTNGLPDRKPGDMSETRHAGGNQLTIRIAPEQFLVLCHLKPGSIAVSKGDSVRQGQVLAQVGNSGHTSEPHLHIHLQDDPGDIGEGIPMYFSNYLLNGKRIVEGMPTGGFTSGGAFKGQIVTHNVRAAN